MRRSTIKRLGVWQEKQLLGAGAELRVSLGGVQEKLLLTDVSLFDGGKAQPGERRWALPNGSVASTHILKPAFAISGGFAALAGAVYASYFGTVQPASFALDFSILFIVMIVIGGVGSVYGSVLGAIAVAVLKDVIDSSKGILQHLPGIQLDPAKNGVTLDILSSLIYGFLLIIFLMFVPTGLAGLWARMRRYFASWPFAS